MGNVFIATFKPQPQCRRPAAGLEITAYDPTIRGPEFGAPVQTLLDAPKTAKVTVQTFDGAMRHDCDPDRLRDLARAHLGPR